MIIGRKAATAADVRQTVLDALRSELVGPSAGYPLVQLNGEEILRPQDPPRYRYACGILFPRGVTYSGSLGAPDDAAGIDAADDITPEEEAVSEAASDEAAATETAVDDTPEVDGEMDVTSMFLPSSMGFSFMADVVGGIRIEASWGTYSKREIDGYPGVLQPEGTKSGRKSELWFRVSGGKTITLSAKDLEFRKVSRKDQRCRIGRRSVPRRCEPAMERQASDNGHLDQWDTHVETDKREVLFPKPVCRLPRRAFAHPSLSRTTRARPGPGRAFSFATLSAPAQLRDRPRLLGRLACRRRGTELRSGPRCSRYSNRPRFFRRDTLDKVELSMKRLADRDRSDIVAALLGFGRGIPKMDRRPREADRGRCYVDAGAQGDGQKTYGYLPRVSREDQVRHEDPERGRYGARCVSPDEQGDVRTARPLQSVGDRAAVGGRPARTRPSQNLRTFNPVYSDTRWRPFQLAFILMNVRAFADPEHADRKRRRRDLVPDRRR